MPYRDGSGLYFHDFLCKDHPVGVFISYLTLFSHQKVMIELEIQGGPKDVGMVEP